MKYKFVEYLEFMGANDFLISKGLVNEFKKIYKEDIIEWCTNHDIDNITTDEQLVDCINEIADMDGNGYEDFIESFSDILYPEKSGNIVMGYQKDDYGDVLVMHVIKGIPENEEEATKLILEYIKKYNISNSSIFETLL